MDMTFICSGHGYENCPDRGRCTAFDGFEIIANPLGGQSNADRESRVFGRDERGYGGVTYASHTIQIGKQEFDRDLYLLISHGAGREVWRIRSFYDGGALRDHILSLPERLQYALCYTLYSTASAARRQAQAETRKTWAEAYVEGRLKKHRAKRGMAAYVEVLPKRAEVDAA